MPRPSPPSRRYRAAAAASEYLRCASRYCWYGVSGCAGTGVMETPGGKLTLARGSGGLGSGGGLAGTAGAPAAAGLRSLAGDLLALLPPLPPSPPVPSEAGKPPGRLARRKAKGKPPPSSWAGGTSSSDSHPSSRRTSRRWCARSAATRCLGSEPIKETSKANEISRSQSRQRACSSCSVVSRAPWLSQASRLTSATLSKAMPTLCSILAPSKKKTSQTRSTVSMGSVLAKMPTNQRVA
mmetsp:Transcript_41265/g.99128  ORF Transcript_41265/g.99128 Transcript_41265/m.99128 type:complete len:239 (-) Transcript_41265:156-872(-)